MVIVLEPSRCGTGFHTASFLDKKSYLKVLDAGPGYTAGTVNTGELLVQFVDA